MGAIRGILFGYLMLLFPLYVMLWRYRTAPLGYLAVLPFSVVLMIVATLVIAVLQACFPGGAGASVVRALVPLTVLPGTGVGYAWWLHRRSGPDQQVRGAEVLPGAEAQQMAPRLKSDPDARPLTLAGVALAPEDESRHFKIIGVTGTGKSTAIAELLRGALARGDRAIIADPDGGYLARFYNRDRDQILNPFDSRAASWDLFSEICEPYDIEHLAHSLITEGKGNEEEWRGYARVFFAEVTRYCHGRNIRDVAELWRLLAIAPNDELRTILAGTPAQPYLDPGVAKLFGSIRSVCGTALTVFRYLATQRDQALSVRQWIQDGQGVLFLPYSAGQIASLASLIATWLRIGIFETMNRPENAAASQHPLWFVVDELDALGAISGLPDALARLRKFGGRCVLGFQSVGQVSGTYTDKYAKTIVENCGTTLILRCSSSENGGTAEFASKLIGLREVLRTEYSTSQSRSDLFSGNGGQTTDTASERRIIESAVLPSEVERLPDLSGFLKVPSLPHWLRVDLPRPE